MQLTISGHQVELTDALKSYVETRFQKLERHFDGIGSAQVVLTVEKQRQIAEATIHVSGADLHASAEQADMYAAIDTLSDKLDRQILKHKEKTVDRSHGNMSR